MAKPKMTGLGKGLDALFANVNVEPEEENIKDELENSGNLKTLKISDVEPNREQSR